MDNPVAAVKSAFSLSLIVRTAVTLILIFAVTDLFGGKDWILSPISKWNNRNAS